MTTFVGALDAMAARGPRTLSHLARADPPAASKAILESYRELSTALGRFLHGDRDPENATFATFAAWSAESLRADVLPGDSASRGPVRPARRLYDAVAQQLLDDPTAMGRNIVSGQAAIFEEISPALGVLLDTTIRATATPKRGAVDWGDVWKALTDGLVERADDLNKDLPAGATRLPDHDVTVLQDAIAPYFHVLRLGLSSASDDGDVEPPVRRRQGRRAALDVDNPPHDDAARRKLRAELILLGNLRLVAYEQRRLQPLLERNLTYLPEAMRVRLAMRWMNRPTLVSGAITRAYPRVAPHLTTLDQAFQILATRYVYSMRLGTERLVFGADLPLPPAAHPMLRTDEPPLDLTRYAEGEFHPYQLQVIETPQLWAEWQQHDRSSGQGVRTSVDNWLRYPERLNFIANMFRSRQQVSALYGGSPLSPSPPEPPVGPGPPIKRPPSLMPDSTTSRLAGVHGRGPVAS